MFSTIVKHLSKHKNLYLILILALCVRLAILYLDWSWDLNNHFVWARDLTNRGFNSKFYYTISSNVFGSLYPNYPPASLYLFYLLYPLTGIIHTCIWWLNVTLPFFPSNAIFFFETYRFTVGLYKIPGIAADFGLAYVLLLILKTIRNDYRNKGLLLFALILFNPVIFYISGFWGQIDSLPIFLALYAFYLALKGKATLLSLCLFTLSLLLKPNAIIYTPIYLFALFNKNKVSSIVYGVLLSLILFHTLHLPFITSPLNPVASFLLYNAKVLQAQSLTSISNGAFNFWVGFFNINGPDTQIAFFRLSYRIIGFILVGSIVAALYYFILRKKTDTYSLIKSLFFISFASFLFMTKMHERYSVLFLPFLAIMAVQQKKYMRWYIVLTFLGFTNMYANWTVPRIEFIKHILEQEYVYRGLSVLTFTIFVYLFIQELIQSHAPLPLGRRTMQHKKKKLKQR